MTDYYTHHLSYNGIPKIAFRDGKDYREFHSLKDCVEVLNEQYSKIKSLKRRLFIENSLCDYHREIAKRDKEEAHRLGKLVAELERCTHLSIEDIILNYGGEIDE